MKALDKITIGSLALAFWVVAVKPIAADTATFREGLNGYTGASDNWLGSFDHPTAGFRNLNFGADALGIGDGSSDGSGSDLRRPILRFDVSSLPGNAIITSATLTLRESFLGPSSGNFTFSVYQIANANAGWIEGTGAYTLAATGESTWNNKAHPSTPWAGSAGLSTAVTDYIAAAVGSGSFTRNDNVENSINISLPTTLIDYWRTTANAGLLIRSDVEATLLQHNQGFASGENATALFRPTLTVEFIPEPSAAMLVGLGVVFLARVRNRMR